jgi:hypothetical protein
MFAYDPSPCIYFPYTRISVEKHFLDESYIFAKLLVCFVQRILVTGLPVFPFYIFGLNVSTGPEKKFLTYIFLQMRRSKW